MDIEEYKKDELSTYIKAERYINNGSPSGFSEINTTSLGTSPKSAQESFDLSVVHVLDDLEFRAIGGVSRYICPKSMFVHPDIIELGLFKKINYSSHGLRVYPTASGRTVLCRENNCFIKLAYPKCLGRMTRHMSFEMVQSAYDVTQLLKNAVDHNGKDVSFGFFREDSGQILYIPSNKLRKDLELPINHDGCYEYGNLYREIRPYPYLKENEYYIPFFSLFGKKDQSPNCNNKHVPILIQLFHKQTKSIEDFVLHDIIFPLYRAYFESLLYAGVELEAHAQNMLISIDENFKINRIICRDLESAGKDLPLMDFRGIKYVPFGKYKTNDLDRSNDTYKYDKYYINHSFMFDFKLGEYIVTPILELIQDFYDIDSKRMSNAIKEYNKKYISLLPDDFFPPDWCYYDNINWEQSGKQREYKWLDAPKYR